MLNLKTDPHASVRFRGTTLDVVSRPADDDERAAAMANSAGIYGGYLKYLSRITGRAVRVFVLEPAG